MIVITIRPDPPNFFPHNIALSESQAWRLMIDLQNLMIPFVLLVSVLLATTGCGAKVDLESANWDSLSGESARTAVEVDLLRPRVSEPVAQATAPPPKPVVSEEKLVIGTGNIIVFNYREGDTHIQAESHIHIHEAPAPKAEERVVVQREVEKEPPRRADERCEQMAREHDERVEMWRKFPLGR